jgi:predicted ABC-type ATPase
MKDRYQFHLFYLWLPSADQAVLRVRERARLGGHSVPEETIRRRYHQGIVNFFSLYRPLATTWRVYDNSDRSGPRPVARGGINLPESILDDAVWSKLIEESNA